MDVCTSLFTQTSVGTNKQTSKQLKEAQNKQTREAQMGRTGIHT